VKLEGQTGLDLTPHKSLGVEIASKLQLVSQKDSNNTGSDQQIFGEINLSNKDNLRPIADRPVQKRKAPAGAEAAIVFGRQSCALNSAVICINSPHSDWPMDKIPSKYQNETSPSDSSWKPAETLDELNEVQDTSLISPHQRGAKKAKRRADCHPGSATTPKMRSQDDTVWVTMDTSTTSGKSWRLAGSLQKTHGTNLGANDQTQSKAKVEGPKVATPKNEGPQSLNVDKEDQHLTNSKAKSRNIIVLEGPLKKGPAFKEGLLYQEDCKINAIITSTSTS
jgi:hypothetical protein